MKKWLGISSLLLFALSFANGQPVVIGNTYTPVPVGITVGTSKVYVTNQADVVSVFDLSGNFISKIGAYGSGQGQLNSPYGIALDAVGNIYVGDGGNARIVVFDASGNFLRSFGSFGKNTSTPKLDIEIDGSDNVFVLDSDNRQVKVFSTQGTLLRTFGASGTNDGQFETPAGIGIDLNNNIYVTDWYFNGTSSVSRIEKFDNAGNFISTITRNAFFEGVGINSTGTIYSADGNCQCVKILNPPNGDQQLGSGIQTGRQGDFYGAAGVDIASNDDVYIVDSGNNRIQVFNSAGTFLREFGSGLSSNGQLKDPIGLAIDAANKIYVANSQNNRIEIFNADGTFNSNLGGYGNGDGLFNFGINPRDVQVDATGNIYALDGGGRIQVFSNTNVYTRSIGSFGTGTGQLSTPLCMTLRGTDVAVAQYGGIVKVFSNAGTQILSFGNTGPSVQQIGYPYSITADASGNFYVAESYRVLVFDNTGQFVRTFGSQGTANNQFNGIGGLAVDANGKIYVTDANRIKVFDNTGTFLGAFGGYGTDPGEFIYPKDMVIKGNTLIVDDVTHIQTLDLTTGFQQSQSISFNSLPNKKYGDGSFSLSATASSGLGVSFQSSNPAVATVSGNTVTIVSVGTTTITATQAGNTNYTNADAVPQILTVDRADAIITFPALPVKTFGDASFTIVASSSSPVPLNYVSDNLQVAVVSSSGLVTIIGAGSATITVTQLGTVLYNPATDASQPLTVNKAIQTLTFTTLPTKTFGDPTFTLTATSQVAPVTFSSSDNTVASISGNTVTLLSAGTTTITASQAGNTNYNSASANQTLTVNKGDQTLSFASLPEKIFGDPNFTLTATSEVAPITFSSSDIAVASIIGNNVTIVSAGTTTITASQAGNTNYNSASVDQILTVDKAPQNIVFDPLTEKKLGDSPFTITASASSGLPVVFTTSSDKISVTNNLVTLLNAGRAAIDAGQAGNSNYSAATSSQDFCIDPPKPVISPSSTSNEIGSSSDTGNQWFLNGASITGANSKTLMATLSGNYTVQVEVDDCLSPISDNYNLVITGDIMTTEALKLFPNPVKDELTIEVEGPSEEAVVFLIFDSVGGAIQSGRGITNQQQMINLRGYSSGIYILEVRTGDNVLRSRLIKD